MTHYNLFRMAAEVMPELIMPSTPGQLEQFANIVAAAEREACAEFLIDLYESDGYYHPAEEFAENAAAAIRARGEK